MFVLCRARMLFAAALASVAVACQPGEAARDDRQEVRAPGDAAREFAIAVDRSRPQLTVKEWKSATGGDSLSLSAYSAGDTLRLVREILTRGTSGRWASRYYFDGAQLRYFESEGDVAAPDAAASRQEQKERLVLAFDEHGATVETSHLVDGAIAPLDSARIQGVVTRAAEVARQWATTPSAARR